MPTEKDANKEIHIRRVVNEIKRMYGFDGILLLAYHHTDESPNLMTSYPVGHVPAMTDVLYSMATLMVTTAYELGKAEGKSEALHIAVSNGDPALKL